MIYIAAPLFNESERAFNARLKLILMRPVFLPQEDGELLADMIEAGVSVDDATNAILRADLKALNQSDILVAVLNGPHVDSGVAFEIGYFSALRKPVIGFSSDIRRELPSGFNPMISGSLWRLVSSEDQLVNAVQDYYSGVDGAYIPD